jgi:uncharacterized protein (DUF58 family)
MADLIPFMIVFMILAAVLHQDSVLTVFYFLFGIIILGRWWSRRSLNNVSIERKFSERVFLGQPIPVKVEITNRGWLPIVWLQVHESLPLALITPNFFRQVVTLGSHKSHTLEYILQANKRGYFSIGPLFYYSGDLWGLSKTDERKGGTANLIIYPRIIPLTQVSLPSQSPFGTLHHKNPIFEDPTRVIGKRDYQVGDSLRRVDWKATAVLRRMQVKQFEASISIETHIFLDLNVDDYDIRQRFVTTELAIVVAASLANWTIQHKQSVGLSTNGLDPFVENQSPSPLPSRKGSSHLMNLLEVLARVQAGKGTGFIDLLHHSLARLSWGATVILITGKHDEALFDELFAARRLGLSIVIILIGEGPEFRKMQLEANRFGFPIYRFISELDLDIWR